MSIRNYIFGLLTTLVLIIAAALTFQSGWIFIKSYGVMQEELMKELALIYVKTEEKPPAVMGYQLTKNWLEVAPEVREHFPVIPAETNIRHSIYKDWIYVQPPERAYSLMVANIDDTIVYVSRFDEQVHETIEHDDMYLLDPMLLIIYFGVGLLALFVAGLSYVLKRIAVPIESIQCWASKLTFDNLDNPLPDFAFNELNTLATLIRQNIQSVAKAVEREQSFLGYASHELRTPIAVLRSNTALLEKVNPTPGEKERVIRDRISRASLTMKSMTETLLWLSRQGDTEMPTEPVSPGQLIKNLKDEIQYLLAGKAVTIELQTDNSEHSLPVTPCLIVLNNLMRNAFQHTQQGHINIVQQQYSVTIANWETGALQTNEQHKELGFGLGMQLVEKLTNQFGWSFDANKTDNGYVATVKFEADSEEK